jgi:hypothetical protein
VPPKQNRQVEPAARRFSESCMMIIHPVASPKRGQNDRKQT